MNKKITVILPLMFLFISSSIFAETIVLKSGKTIEGKILEKTDKDIKVDIEGIHITYYIDDISSIDGEKIILSPSTEIVNENKISPTSQNDNTSTKEALGNAAISSDETETKFKDVATQIAKEFNQIISEKDKKSQALNKEGRVARQARLFNEWNESLQNIIKADPKSIWADDAQYTLAILNAANPKQETLELEYLLKEYPNMHIEDWTKETLAVMMPTPKIPFEATVRLQLCFRYKDFGDTVKLKAMCEKSIKKYPNNAKIFEKLLQETAANPK